MFAVWLKRDLETFNTYIVRLFSLSRSGAQGRTCCRWTSIVLNLQLVDQINQWETNIHKGRIHNLNFLKSAHIVLIKSPADLSLPAFTMLTSEKVLLKLKLINWLIISHHEKIWIFFIHIKHFHHYLCTSAYQYSMHDNAHNEFQFICKALFTTYCISLQSCTKKKHHGEDDVINVSKAITEEKQTRTDRYRRIIKWKLRWRLQRPIYHPERKPAHSCTQCNKKTAKM